MEYKRSTDGGETWSEPIVLDYSKEAFLDGMFTVSCEKAVRAADGSIVLICLRNLCQPAWEPWLTPTVLRSEDGGETWSEPVGLTPDAGRTYDLRVSEKDGAIYALHFANDAKKFFCGNAPEHRYKLLISRDNGRTFSERSVVPFDTDGRGYGSLMLAPDGRMIAYAYNSRNEYELDCCISRDDGLTWEQPSHCHVAKRIRNPQTAYLNGVYFLHGRSGVTPELPINFVLYTSPDGLNWDGGVYLRVTPEGARGGASYYSNNLVTGTLGQGKRRLLIQTSDAYEEARTDIRHWWIDADE